MQTARLLSAANNTNPTLIRAGGTRIYRVSGYNAAAAVRFLKIYNKATAPTVGTDTPIRIIPLGASLAFSHYFPEGIYCAQGAGYGIVNLGADSDTTAPTAADIVGLSIDYD